MVDLKSEILRDNSGANTMRIISWAGGDEEKINQVVDLIHADEERVVQRASWIISGIAERYPALFERYLPAFVDRITDERVHVTVKRNLVRLLQFVEIPESLKGCVLDTCFGFLEDPKEGNAVQVFSMTVVEKIAKDFPEIIPELQLSIERNLENGATPAFISRARKILFRLGKTHDSVLD